MMEDPLEVELLKARDLAVYGSPDGPSFAYLMGKYGQDVFSMEEVYGRAAQTLNPDVNP